MNFEEFCARLSAIKDKFKWFYVEGVCDAYIRCTAVEDQTNANDYTYCPITALTFGITGVVYSKCRWQQAATKIGLSYDAAFEIIKAADSWDSGNLAYKKQIAAAVGLPPKEKNE